MLARRYLPRVVRSDVTGPGNTLDVTAKTDEAGKVLQLQVVNLHPKPVSGTLHLAGFKPVKPVAQVAELAAELDAVNTAADPRRVTPAEREWRPQFKDGATEYTFPAYSFTILRFE
jgi:alpha-L-arabinofuranosidase